MLNAYEAKPWHGLYDAGQPFDLVPDHTDALALFRAAVRRAPDHPALLYFDATLTYAELDRLSDGLACRLRAAGFARGDRLGIYLQNVPHFPLALLAAWKAGGIAVAINPMNRARELTNLLEDSTPRALVCQDTLYAEVVASLPARPALCLTVSARDFQTRDDPRLFAAPPPAPAEGGEDLLAAIARHAGEVPPTVAFTPDETAMLVYTSGTTGVPKGAMCTHGNVCFNAQAYRDWIGLREGEPILGLAPLFHITGLIGHIVAAFLTASPLVLTYRFEPGVMLAAIAEHRPCFTIGAITAFIALMNHPAAQGPEAFESLRVIYTGGAPVPARVVEDFAARFGQYIHNGYGLTETNSPTHVVPRGRRAPVDAASGALSVGVPCYGVSAWVCDEADRVLPPGESGEIVLAGPMVVPGYWRKPAETAEAMRGGGFHTGDVGFMDAEGWFYIVDRKKDMINAAGYKVWPREVEDVVYGHPAVREAAVVGIADDYRGETVKLVVSLKPGQSVSEAELIAFCRPRMAAYKCPRVVAIIDELPKTPTGKILRRELR